MAGVQDVDGMRPTVVDKSVPVDQIAFVQIICRPRGIAEVKKLGLAVRKTRDVVNRYVGPQRRQIRLVE